MFESQLDKRSLANNYIFPCVGGLFFKMIESGTVRNWVGCVDWHTSSSVKSGRADRRSTVCGHRGESFFFLQKPKDLTAHFLTGRATPPPLAREVSTSFMLTSHPAPALGESSGPCSPRRDRLPVGKQVEGRFFPASG